MSQLILGDCLQRIQDISTDSIDMIYLDPPFYTQKSHTLKTRDNTTEYKFEDTWDSLDDYLDFMYVRLVEFHRVLKNTGSIFLHCDKSASHHLRVLLDKVFGTDNFQSEVIWAYKRWSNSKKGLLNGHQTIYFYSKSDDFKFNMIYSDYSPTTNVDQILQDRVRNENGKAVYRRDDDGNVVLGKEKKGVPLSDVWNIPYLNPKAKERIGYPTQKPILLLEQIIKISTDENDTVLDPFCGSGTTLVASQLLNRKYVGIDLSPDAIELSRKRLEEPIKSRSFLLEKGEEAYKEKSEYELAILRFLDATTVQRNKGIDGFLREFHLGRPVSVRIQKPGESLEEAKRKLILSSKTKSCSMMILVRTHQDEDFTLFKHDSDDRNDLLIIDGLDLTVQKLLGEHEQVSQLHIQG